MSDDLREAYEHRKAWFYETQLRGLNLQRFREVRPDSTDPRLDLISEFVDGHRVYLDSGQPVWTAQDKERHDAFAGTLIGQHGDFLDYREPRRLAEFLTALRDGQESNRYGLAVDESGLLQRLGREPPQLVGPDTAEGDSKGAAVARAELAAQRPWLIPDLFPLAAVVKGTGPAAAWATHLEQFLEDFETELRLAAGTPPADVPRFDPHGPGEYRRAIGTLLAASTQRPAGLSVQVKLLDRETMEVENPFAQSPTPGSPVKNTITVPFWVSRHSVGAGDVPMTRVADVTASAKVRYWSGAIHGSLRECVANKPNSDMGLCLLVRMLYRYGTLPTTMAQGTPSWRHRTAPSDELEQVVARWLQGLGPQDAELAERLRTAGSRLRIVLEESARVPNSPDPCWSPLAGEILQQGLLSYKFWMDEHPHARDNETWNDLKKNLGYGEAADQEMEYWSENHYIMFASSEYLLGQLWPDEEFQPGRLVAAADDTTGRRPGSDRRDRGRARVLKWLNNRLMFGWMEFNSSGYYREHLWALLNLVDFALDEEVRTKATMAVDLMLFDVARFLHRGSQGAAGGRSQFKSKSDGFDNGLSDVVELLWGCKGVYAENGSNIGVSMASSTYEVPEVLLEIGANPPTFPFVDRSRVSITFEEAPKYGITWSMASKAKDSLLAGYATKRAEHWPHLARVNAEIEGTHDGYGAGADDTVFFWGMSAFFNKQVVRNSLAVVHQFGLENADAFRLLATIMEVVGPVVALPSHFLENPFSSIASVFSGDLSGELSEDTADALSVILEGSTRSRANILTYRSPGAMLSTIQNFRTGQVNFQSSIQQATLSGTANVFVNAGFGGIDLSDLAVLGGAITVAGVAGGVTGYVLYKNMVEDTNPFDPSNKDGVAWWTGNWSVPRTLQHRGAVILLSDFHDVQEILADASSHTWFPKSGFDRVIERRTSAYDDANFPLLDIGHIGAKGFWLFGRVVAPRPAGTTDPPEEGYVGVFSNDRPQWLTKDDDPYEPRWDDAEDDNEGLWKDAPDLFVDKDWYVDGKNVWIVQIGSRSEFGSFESFVERVSSARIHVDDAGDLECTYDTPLPDGGADRMRLTDTDEPEFEVNGKPVATDLFPRFENPFVRGGQVEWGQRSYVLEWNGRSLLHDFEDFSHPVRQEDPESAPDDARTIRALVIYLRTEDEEMDAFSNAVATVEVGCLRLTTEQTVAVGPVGEDTDHDAEWVFLDRPVFLDADMTLELLGTGSGDAEWTATYTLRALMGDLTLRDCATPVNRVEFDDEHRRSGPRPFAVRTSSWAPWRQVPGRVDIAQWQLARRATAPGLWSDHHDLWALARDGRLWHKRASCGLGAGIWAMVPAPDGGDTWTGQLSLAAVTTSLGDQHAVALYEGRLWSRTSDLTGRWPGPWQDLAPVYLAGIQPKPVPLAVGSVLTAQPQGFPGDRTDLAVVGADGGLYVCRDWAPGSTDLWQRIRTPAFTLAPGQAVALVGEVVVARSTDGALWLWSGTTLIGGVWEELTGPGFRVERFAVGGTESDLVLACLGPAGTVRTARRQGAVPVHWQEPRPEDDWRPGPRTALSWVAASAGVQWLVAAGADGTIRRCAVDVGIWTVVGASPGPPHGGDGHVLAVSRFDGQVEVFASYEAVDGPALAWTWWS